MVTLDIHVSHMHPIHKSTCTHPEAKPTPTPTPTPTHMNTINVQLFWLKSGCLTVIMEAELFDESEHGSNAAGSDTDLSEASPPSTVKRGKLNSGAASVASESSRFSPGKKQRGAAEAALPSKSRNGTPPQKPKRKAAGTGSAASSAGAGKDKLLCIVCNVEPRYCRLRFCKVHKTAYDNMMYQAQNPGKGQPSQVEAFLQVMADDDQSVSVIKAWEKVNPLNKKYQKKKLINWAQFCNRYGVRVSHKQRQGEVPMEQTQYIIWKTDKLGWPMPLAEQAWKQELLSKEIADYEGQQGSVRLWIHKKAARLRDIETYSDNFLDQGSDKLKNPKVADIDSLRLFSHASAPDHSHEFFSGKSTLEKQEAAGSLDALPFLRRPTIDKKDKKGKQDGMHQGEDELEEEDELVHDAGEDEDLGALRMEKYEELTSRLAAELKKLEQAHQRSIVILRQLSGTTTEGLPVKPRTSVEATLRSNYLGNYGYRARVVAAVLDQPFDIEILHNFVKTRNTSFTPHLLLQPPAPGTPGGAAEGPAAEAKPGGSLAAAADPAQPRGGPAYPAHKRPKVEQVETENLDTAGVAELKFAEEEQRIPSRPGQSAKPLGQAPPSNEGAGLIGVRLRKKTSFVVGDIEAVASSNAKQVTVSPPSETVQEKQVEEVAEQQEQDDEPDEDELKDDPLRHEENPEEKEKEEHVTPELQEEKEKADAQLAQDKKEEREPARKPAEEEGDTAGRKLDVAVLDQGGQGEAPSIHPSMVVNLESPLNTLRITIAAAQPGQNNVKQPKDLILVSVAEEEVNKITVVEDFAKMKALSAKFNKYMTAYTQLSSGSAKATADLKRHLTITKRKSDQDNKKESAAVEKTSIEHAKKTALQNAAQVRQEKLDSRTVAKPIFSIADEKLDEIQVMAEDNHVGGGEVPKKWGIRNTSVQEFLGKYVMQRELCKFGGGYKRLKTYDTLLWAQQVTVEKAGKEDIEELFSTFHADSVCIKKINPNFATTSWWFGCAPTLVNVDTLPNAAGQFRLLAMGEMQVRAVAASDIVDNPLPGMPERPTVADALKSFSEMRAAPESGIKIFSTTLKAGELLWLPCGYLVAERSLRGPLVYGIRKSVFTAHPESKKNMDAVIGMLKQEKKSTSRLEEVAALLPSDLR